jgi:uridine kinase
MNKTNVIAISGVSGAGKTTAVKQLAKMFSSPYLLFDDHIDNSTYPQNMRNWLKQGANVSLIKTPTLVSSLKDLLSKNNSLYIFVEEPFGKERDSISALIDYVILLDQPMELCLALIIRRHTVQSNYQDKNSISIYLDKYEDHFREIYLCTRNQVRHNADLIIKEVLSIEDLSGFISAWLKNIKNK